MYKAVVVFIMLITSSCVQTHANTLQQRYFAAKADYKNILHVAVAYKTVCDKRGKDDECYAVLDKFRDYDAKIHLAFTVADIALTNDNVEKATSSLDDISAGVSVLSAYVIDNMD
jgi:hypothetical protein